MKRFFEAVIEWKTWACVMFGASMIIYMVVSFLMGNTMLELSVVFSILIISAIGTLIQFFAFSGRFFKKSRYTTRLLIFVVPFLALLTGCAFWFNWFPTQYSSAWIIFVGIFLLAFAAMTAFFEIYYRIVGKKYDGLLGQYKRTKEIQK